MAKLSNKQARRKARLEAVRRKELKEAARLEAMRRNELKEKRELEHLKAELVEAFKKLSPKSKQRMLDDLIHVEKFIEERIGTKIEYEHTCYVSNPTLRCLKTLTRPWKSAMKGEPIEDESVPYLSVVPWNVFLSSMFKYVDEKWPCPSDQPESVRIDYDEMLTLNNIVECEFNRKYLFSNYVNKVLYEMY